MAIDTDDLSRRTYKAIMIEAERFNHDLTLQFGLLSYECEDEKDFIAKSIDLIHEMLKYDEDDLEEIFFDELPDMEDFHTTLNKILDNINKLKKG